MARIKAGALHIGYSERGRGQAVVFLHGVGSDRSVWQPQIDHFGRRWRAVALDYPGYGESDLPAGDLDRAAIAGCVAEAMDALQIGAAHIVGLSMGGVIALELALQQPSRLRSLVLADTFAWHPDGAAIVERAYQALATLTMREFAERRAGFILGPQAAEALRQDFIETMARIDRRTYRWATAAVWTPDYRAELARITTPALILVGEHDQATPPALSAALQQGMRGAALQIIPGAGHLSNVENPAAFNQYVEAFIAAVGAPGIGPVEA